MNNNIEEAFQGMLNQYNHNQGKKRSKSTGIESVLQFLLDRPDVIWWWSWEFVGKTTSKGDWLSHRAPARASDLAIHHSQMVEDRKIGRYAVYRLRTENLGLIKEFLAK